MGSKLTFIMIVLSVLIPTIPERHEMFTTLYNKISRQITYCNTTHPSLGRVELLVDDSKKFLDGGLSIGKKRQALLKRAEGYYTCFCDDDEDVSPNYIETLLRMAERNADIITFRNFTILETYWMMVDMGIYYPNDQPTGKHMIRRRPWHICPVKRTFAQLYDFEDSNYGEDFNWMEKVLTHVTTEAHTDAIIHCYRHGKHSEADKIMNHA